MSISKGFTDFFYCASGLENPTELFNQRKPEFKALCQQLCLPCFLSKENTISHQCFPFQTQDKPGGAQHSGILSLPALVHPPALHKVMKSDIFGSQINITTSARRPTCANRAVWIQFWHDLRSHEIVPERSSRAFFTHLPNEVSCVNALLPSLILTSLNSYRYYQVLFLPPYLKIRTPLKCPVIVTSPTS